MPLPFEILFIEHGYPGVDTLAILKDRETRKLNVPVVTPLVFRPNNPCRMLRTMGAAVVPPWPPCSTRATTTYLGLFAGAMAANHE